MPRLLLLVPTTTFRAKAFMHAAYGLDIEVTVATEQASTMAGAHPTALLTLDFSDPDRAAADAVAFARANPIHAVVSVDDEATIAAAAIAESLGLPRNSIDAIRDTRDKHRMRECFASADVPSPRYTLVSLDEEPSAVADRVAYPCVAKPLTLSSSRGVIRADNATELVVAIQRITTILHRIEQDSPGQNRREILIEDFIPGREVALEGLLSDGELQVLALFDKPDPLDGPYFTETIYVTPSRLSADVQRQIVDCTDKAARALGLRHGPIHAELRINDDGPWLVEVAGRSIGGYCSRTLRFGDGVSLEELILRHAMGMDISTLKRQEGASGVMMIPTPRAGEFKGVKGLDRARAVADIDDVVISAHPSRYVEPLPDSGFYLGFIFARAETPQRVEAALRHAHRELEIIITPADTKRRRKTARDAVES